MSYIDIFVIAIAAIGLLLGLTGKAPKKLANLIIVIAAVVTAYFTCGLVANILLENFGSIIFDTVGSMTSEFGMNPSSINGLITGLVKMLTFWLEAILLIIAFRIVFGIICAIALRKCKKKTAVKTLGIFGLLNGAIFAVVLVFPIIALSPLLGNLSSIASSVPELGSAGSILSVVETQVNTSKVVDLGMKVIDNDKFQLECLTYEVEGEDRYLMDDMKSFKGILKMASLIMPKDNGEEVDMLATFSSLSDEDIRALVASDTVKEIVVDVVNEYGADMGIALPEDFDLSKEADMIIAVKDIVSTDDNGEMTIDPSKIDVNELANAMAESELVVVIANSAPGALSDIDATTKTQIESALQAKDLDQDKYDAIMQLFNAPAEQ